MRPQRLVKASLVACLVGAVIMMVGSTGIAQKGGGKGGGGGHTETENNQLSYPAVMIGEASSLAESLTPAPPSALDPGVTYSYGCEPDETIGTTTYPNTSCYEETALGIDYLSAAECTAENAKCFGQTLSRIYWQKVPNQTWSAEKTGAVVSSAYPVTVQYLDWGDNLESKSWTTTSTIRVETTPFKDHSTAKLNDSDTTLKRGYQMWHVYGQGTNEVWGIRATDDGTSVYGYDSPFSIIRSTRARINFAKLQVAAAACPTSPGWLPPYTLPTVWSDTDGWTLASGCQVKDEAYTAELNVGGKYVYGYNWSIRNDLTTLQKYCGAGASLAGWWRLTFYTPPDPATGLADVKFALADIPTSPPPLENYLDPIQYVAATVSVTRVASEEEGGDTGELYGPKIDVTNNLTYIDICVTSGGGGGGKK